MQKYLSWRICNRRHLKRRCKRRNCSWWKISPFATMFSSLFNNLNLIYRDLLNLSKDVFKVVFCRFAVCGKWLNPYKFVLNFSKWCVILLSEVFHIYHNDFWVNQKGIQLENTYQNGKHFGKRRNCSSLCFQKAVCYI